MSETSGSEHRRPSRSLLDDVLRDCFVNETPVNKGQAKVPIKDTSDDESLTGECPDFAHEIGKHFSKSPDDVKSDIGYPKGFRFRTTAEQVTALREVFPMMGITDTEAEAVNRKAESRLILDMEFKAVIPYYRDVAATSKEFHSGMSEIESYCLATNVVVRKLWDASFLGFGDHIHNLPQQKVIREKGHLHGRLTANHLRLTGKLGRAHEQLKASHGKLWVVDTQFGKLHAGRIVHRARECMSAGEFGFGPYEVGILLLTHPDRINPGDSLGMYCAGVDFRRDEKNHFCEFIRFFWLNLFFQAGICSTYCENAYAEFGSVTGSLSSRHS